MNESTADLARGWIEAWIRMDMEWLEERLSPDFIHISPFGRLEGRDHYLRTVEPMARKSVQELEIREIVASGSQAAVWFDNRSAGGVVPTCDWVRTRGGLIVEIRSFYDSAAIRDVLSPEEQRRLNRSQRTDPG